jgi:hypothetical protein
LRHARRVRFIEFGRQALALPVQFLGCAFCGNHELFLGIFNRFFNVCEFFGHGGIPP